jgi:hypothetical protein
MPIDIMKHLRDDSLRTVTKLQAEETLQSTTYAIMDPNQMFCMHVLNDLLGKIVAVPSIRDLNTSFVSTNAAH